MSPLTALPAGLAHENAGRDGGAGCCLARDASPEGIICAGIRNTLIQPVDERDALRDKPYVGQRPSGTVPVGRALLLLLAEDTPASETTTIEAAQAPLTLLAVLVVACRAIRPAEEYAVHRE